MYLKTTLFASILLILSSATYAQDKIFKKDGSVIEAKVLEVGVKTVSYKRIDNEDGPRYTVAKSSLDRIEYENGSNDFFDQRSKEEHSPKVDNSALYGNNIISFFPMLVNNGGIGLGVSYERLFGKKSFISFYMPFSVTLNSGENDYYYYNGGNQPEDQYTYTFMPGVKIYPTGAKGKVRYAIGPSLAFQFGKEYSGVMPLYNSNGTVFAQVPVYRDRFLAGAVVTNSLNVSPTKHLYLGIELALGFVFYEDYNGYSNTYTFEPYDMDEPIAQFGFKIGYRF